MNDSYYRDLIDKVQANQDNMFYGMDESEKDFEDFSKLWEILFDDDSAITHATFFDASDLCLYSFYGCSQNPEVVWNSILNRFKSALNEDSEYNEFREGFINFSNYNSQEGGIPSTISYEMMRCAIEKGDLLLISAILNLAITEDLWNEGNSEWDVWLAIFSDKDFFEVENCQESIKALDNLKGKFHDPVILERMESLDEILNG
ncbi:MAG: hypothetical protein K2K64_10890 [Muribaculaceae bacterium]|nr:hypothetical protein [Muribaculaceae bacterium]